MLKQQKMREQPQEICMEILCRLPLRSIIKSRAVSRDWRHLIESPDFTRRFRRIRFHLLVFPDVSIAAPIPTPPNLRIIEDPVNIDNSNNINVNIVSLDLFGCIPLLRTSVDGLILLLLRHQRHLWICNPVTREYLTIPAPPNCIHYNLRRPPDFMIPAHAPSYLNFNFNFALGASRRSSEYKAVWISGRSEWHVFDLGRKGAEWRTIANGPTISRPSMWNTESAFLAGSFYWLDPDTKSSRFWCFDLETEAFTTFLSAPPPPPCLHYRRTLTVLEECLCLCDMSLKSEEPDAVLEVWMMSKEVGGVWSKEYVITRGFGRRLANVVPIKVLEDGVGGLLLAERGEPNLLHYSENSTCGRSIRRLYGYHSFDYGDKWFPRAALYSPSFRPLKTLFPDTDVQSLLRSA